MTPWLAVLLAWAGPALSAPARRPSVVLIVVDDLRADHLGAYGRKPSLSPALDSATADASVFLDAYSQAGWTLPSVSSIFTGQYPTTHGVHRAVGSAWSDDGHADRLKLLPGHRLPSERLTIAAALSRAGYKTAAFVSCPFGDPAFGWDNGYDVYEDDGGAFTAVAERAGRWLSARDRSTPFFLYLHAFDAHAGAEHALVSSLEERSVRSSYALGVSHFDAGFARLVSVLREQGAWDDVLLVITADHGEELWECGHQGHGASTCGSALHVPLIVRTPGGAAGRRLSGAVGLIDLFPTIADFAGLPRPPGLQGEDLRPALEGSSVPVRAVYTEIYPHFPPDNQDLEAVVTRDGEWKLVTRYNDSLGRRDELYLLSADPGERADALAPADELKARIKGWAKADRERLLKESPDARRRLAAETAAWRAKLEAAGAPRQDEFEGRRAAPSAAEKLRRAGYIK